MSNRRIKKIVEADTTPVDQPPLINLADVGEMVMVGRYKSGEEFIIPVYFDDALKGEAYCNMGVKYFGLIIEKHLYRRMQLADAVKEQQE